MKTRLRRLIERIRESYWFVPALMSIAAILLAMVMLGIDRGVADEALVSWGIIYTGGPDGARELLGTVAASVITVAGVVFSITIVALQLASSQFGPRLLRNFMRDVVNQISLGTFVATFLYCMLILRSVRTGDGTAGSQFIPHLAVTVGMALMMLSLGVLIYYIHHTAGLIQAPNVIANVAEELDEVIEVLFPRRTGQPPRTGDPQPGQRFSLPAEFHEQAEEINSPLSGYVQAIIDEDLMELMVRHDLQCELLLRPGHFVIKDQPLIRVGPAEGLTGKQRKKLADAFIIGRHRTLTQDAEFGIDQLVEVAVRALSKGVNDPFTAITCVDRIAAVLATLARREFPSPYRLDDAGRLRVQGHPYDFRGFVAAGFNQIRENAAGVVAVVIRMLEAIQSVAGHAKYADDLEALWHHAELIRRGGVATISDPADRNDIYTRYRDVVCAIQCRLAEATERREGDTPTPAVGKPSGPRCTGEIEQKALS